MKIKKTSETTPKLSQTVNSYNESTTDTYSCDYINKQNTYSTEEQRIGTWIDGKPLYRKVYKLSNVTIPKDTEIQLFEISMPVDTVFIENSFWNDPSQSNIVMSIPSNYYTYTTNFNYIGIYNNYVVLRSGLTVNKDIIISLCYTKTTD